eukprot:GHVS01037918.1.p2 GENE.GHVS01037918.1~~GHVS01037918.1.p2  ORF type:complete len:111 (+),score=4.99 GHVS01037918.1:132-464(+)
MYANYTTLHLHCNTTKLWPFSLRPLSFSMHSYAGQLSPSGGILMLVDFFLCWPILMLVHPFISSLPICWAFLYKYRHTILATTPPRDATIHTTDKTISALLSSTRTEAST